MASSAAVTIQVAGPTATRTVLSPVFTILSFDDDTEAEVGCCDGPGGQVLITSRAALTPAQSVELIESLTRG